MSKLIGSRGGKCFLVTVAGLSGKVGADDESEAIRMFRDHHRIIDNGQRASVESAEFDPEVEKLEPIKETKPKGKGKGKGNVAETAKDETAKPDGAENTEGEASASDAASTSSEDSAKSQEPASGAE